MLATDEWLRVLGCDNVYALGDCATISQRKVMVRALINFEVSFLFTMSDISTFELNLKFYIGVTLLSFREYFLLI